jgi:DNA-binding NarL/FixJ family response regulator
VKIRILFVDDEPRVLEGLQRVMRPLRATWEVSTATGGVAALAMIDVEPFDFVVSDMRMPGMGGAEFLARVCERRPGSVRFVLSGQTEPKYAIRTVSLAHQFLSKPSDPETLFAALERARVALATFGDSAERDFVVGIGALPCSAAAARALHAQLGAEEPSIDEIARIVAQDTAMCAKLLQLVNSSFFRAHRNITDASDAVKLLGAKLLGDIARETNVFAPGEIVDVGVGEAGQCDTSEARDTRDARDASDTPKKSFAARVGELALTPAMRALGGTERAEASLRLGRALLGLWRVPLS